MKAFLVVIILFVSATSSYAADPSESLVRVYVTRQAWDYWQPWEKKNPTNDTAMAAVIEGNKVLVSGKFVTNATWLSFEHPQTREKIPARVEAVDYEANIALLSATEPFFPDRVPMALDTGTKVGDQVEVWQVEYNGEPFQIPGKVTRIARSSYFLGQGYFLAYRVTGPMQFRGGSDNVPVVSDGKLIGLLVSYSASNQESGVISAPIIQHFLTDWSDGKYEGPIQNANASEGGRGAVMW